MEKITLTRQQLFNLVWSEALLTLSKKYVISDVGLRKMCVRLSIPLPRVGHWAKLPADRPVPGKLPPSASREQSVTLQVRTGLKEGEASAVLLSDLRKAVESDPKLKLVVPDRLTAPDKLIVAAKERLQAKPNQYSQYKGVVRSDGDTLDIRVSPVNVSRALRFLDTLIKVLRARGHNVVIEKDATYALVNGQQIKISYRERFKQVTVTDDGWSRTEWHASGIVFFKTEGFSGREWKDGKQTMEAQLPAVLAKLEIDSRQLAEREALWKKQREEYETQARIRREQIERKEQELAGFKALLRQAARWRQATQLREYIGATEQDAIARGGLSEEGQTWLDWARGKIDWYDPLIEKEDEFLKEVDRETLTFKR